MVPLWCMLASKVHDVELAFEVVGVVSVVFVVAIIVSAVRGPRPTLGVHAANGDSSVTSPPRKDGTSVEKGPLLQQ